MISLCTAICTHHKPQKGALSPGQRRTGGAARWAAAGRTRDIAGCPGEESRWRLRWSGKRRCATSKTNTRLEPVLLLVVVTVVVVGIVFSSLESCPGKSTRNFRRTGEGQRPSYAPVDCPVSLSLSRVVFRNSSIPNTRYFFNVARRAGICRPFVTNRTANRFDHAPPFLRSGISAVSSFLLFFFFFSKLNFRE